MGYSPVTTYGWCHSNGLLEIPKRGSYFLQKPKHGSVFFPKFAQFLDRKNWEYNLRSLEQNEFFKLVGNDFKTVQLVDLYCPLIMITTQNRTYPPFDGSWVLKFPQRVLRHSHHPNQI